MCDTFLTFPPRYEASVNDRDWLNGIAREVLQLFKVKTTEEIENIMKAILQMFHSSLN